MNRKSFIRHGFLGMGAVLELPSVVSSCQKEVAIIKTIGCEGL